MATVQFQIWRQTASLFAAHGITRHLHERFTLSAFLFTQAYVLNVGGRATAESQQLKPHSDQGAAQLGVLILTSDDLYRMRLSH